MSPVKKGLLFLAAAVAFMAACGELAGLTYYALTEWRTGATLNYWEVRPWSIIEIKNAYGKDLDFKLSAIAGIVPLVAGFLLGAYLLQPRPTHKGDARWANEHEIRSANLRK